jgi:hypothetical protein
MCVLDSATGTSKLLICLGAWAHKGLGRAERGQMLWIPQDAFIQPSTRSGGRAGMDVEQCSPMAMECSILGCGRFGIDGEIVLRNERAAPDVATLADVNLPRPMAIVGKCRGGAGCLPHARILSARADRSEEPHVARRMVQMGRRRAGGDGGAFGAIQLTPGQLRLVSWSIGTVELELSGRWLRLLRHATGRKSSSNGNKSGKCCS